MATGTQNKNLSCRRKAARLCLTSSAVFYYLFIYLFENRRQRTGIGHYHAMKMK